VDVLEAFLSYCRSLPPDGQLVANNDDPGAREVMDRIRRERKDIRIVPYGRNAEGRFRIVRIDPRAGATRFVLSGLKEQLRLRYPGIHSVYNAAAAIALSCSLLETEGREFSAELGHSLARTLEEYRGSRRRSEVLGTAGGVLFMDDYGHHPTEIAATLQGLKQFYPQRRLVVDFMSHTYSRTKALLGDFATSFRDADLVVLHRIYASARESSNGGVDGRTLFEEVRRHHPKVVYFEEPEEAIPYLQENLKSGDLLITMGAGDNWRIGRKIYEGRAQVTQ
jgi:UDP-N-acetylmuramate--alanine ligase